MTEGTAAGSAASVDSAPPPASLAWALAPIVVAIGSLAVGAIALGHRSLTADEAVSFVKADAPLRAVLSTIVHDAPGQAGGLLALKLATVAGRDELALRAPSAIAIALAAGLLVVLGTLLLGRVAGLVAGVALAANAGVIEVSREARPFALGILGIVLATLLFVLALERGGGGRWVAYAIVAAALPLTHPLAASVLAAHGAALITLRDRPDARRAGVALGTGTAVAGLVLAWMAVDRLGALDGAETLDLQRLGRGLAHPIGWNPILLLAAITGLVALFTAGGSAGRHWRGLLVTTMITAPLIGTLLAAIAVSVHTGPLVLCAPGVALAAGAAVPLLPTERNLLRAGIAVLVVTSAAATALRLTTPANEDWRALAAAVKRVRGPRETVVVVPERGTAAFAYYAPYVPVIRVARGGGAWVAVIADTPAGAIAAARPFVETPRYALLRQFRYGNGLRLQHWVRP